MNQSRAPNAASRRNGDRKEGGRPQKKQRSASAADDEVLQQPTFDQVDMAKAVTLAATEAASQVARRHIEAVSQLTKELGTKVNLVQGRLDQQDMTLKRMQADIRALQANSGPQRARMLPYTHGRAALLNLAENFTNYLTYEAVIGQGIKRHLTKKSNWLFIERQHGRAELAGDGRAMTKLFSGVIVTANNRGRPVERRVRIAVSAQNTGFQESGVGILFATPDIIIQRVAYQLLE